jgi:ubiquinone/menaquinone biosynthesis C-methylase UbiE
MAISEDALADDSGAQRPFSIEDLTVFDDETLLRIVKNDGFGLSLRQLAYSMHGASPELIKRVKQNVGPTRQAYFRAQMRKPLHEEEIQFNREKVLNELFWELTYWKTPDLYEDLTEGERIHPAIFQQLDADLRDKIVLDAGAGSGRATFECLRYHARLVYAMEPSPGLRQILVRKLNQEQRRHIRLCSGRFDAIPLPDNSVDIALSCSAFTADPSQGGEASLREFRRVTRAGGKIIIVWPRVEDRDWLEQQGFQYFTAPLQHEMHVHFRSLRVALTCVRRFYASSHEALDYLLTRQRPEIPFSLLHLSPPREYCWLEVAK